MVELKNSIRYLICLLLFLFLTILNVNSQKKQELKSWDSKNKLKIKDFKSLSVIDNISAQTFVLIDFILINEYTFGVEAIFSKEKSFFIKDIDTTKNRYLLKHEQLHFDIAELFARKIRKKFYSLYIDDIFEEDAYWLEYEYYIKKYREYNIQYDKDSDHSRNKKQQKVWLDKIKLELNKLEKFTHKCYLELIE